MQKDDLKHKIITALNQKAEHHHKKHMVVSNVFAKIAQNEHERFNRWGMAGFALAAAITGVVVVPNSFFDESQRPAQITVTSTAKLTPQLADDLEMLLVLGEDVTHGS